MSFFVRSPGLSIKDRKLGYTYFQTILAEMTLKDDQGH